MQTPETSIKLYFLRGQVSLRAMRRLARGADARVRVVASPQEKKQIEEQAQLTLHSLPCLVDGNRPIYRLDQMVALLCRPSPFSQRLPCPGRLCKQLVYSFYDHMLYARKMDLSPSCPDQLRSHAVLSQQAQALDNHLHQHKHLFLKDNIRFEDIAMFQAAQEFLRREQERPLPYLRQAVRVLEDNLVVAQMGCDRVCLGKLEEQCREDLVALLEEE